MLVNHNWTFEFPASVTRALSVGCVQGGIPSPDGEPPTKIVSSWNEVTPALDARELAALDPAFADRHPRDLSIVWPSEKT